MRCSAFARRLSVVGLMALLMVAVGPPSPARAAEIAVTPATFASAFASAAPGDTLLLASGDYGEFQGAMKPGPARVTIKPQPGATARMAFSFNPASNITLEGLRITDGYVADSRTKNITIRNSSFDGARFLARGGQGDLVNANVLLDGNTHRNVDVCSGCYDGRVQIAERTEQPTGITIQNSLFEGGNADGIQNGGNGTRIIANTFRGLHQPDDESIAHTGSIQLYGSKNTLIKGNFFYDVSVAVGAYDRVDHEVIEDNVIVLDGHNAWVSEFLSDEGSIWRHNTFASFDTSGSTSCAFGVPCGTIHTGHKEGDPPSKGTVFIDNILARIDGEPSDFAGGREDYNLFTSRVGWGTHDMLGQPRYVGGDRPTTYEGFKLAAGSPGKGTASDGLDRGVRYGDAPAPEPEPEPVTGVTLFGDATPANPSASDHNAVELGVRFRADRDGHVSAIRFYKGAGNTGTHVGNLWTAEGTKLASVTFANETASGWQEATLSTPVAITAGQTYVASYHAPNGGYAANRWFFEEAYSNGSLTAPAESNGVFAYGPGGFPSRTYNATNYWVDVVFTASTPEPGPDPPTASYAYSPTSPDVSQAVTFDATGSSCPASSCSYRWEDDRPDGPGGTQWLLGTGRVTTVYFAQAGDRYVRLTVTDSQGRSDSTVKTVTVRR